MNEKTQWLISLIQIFKDRQCYKCLDKWLIMRSLNNYNTTRLLIYNAVNNLSDLTKKKTYPTEVRQHTRSCLLRFVWIPNRLSFRVFTAFPHFCLSVSNYNALAENKSALVTRSKMKLQFHLITDAKFIRKEKKNELTTDFSMPLFEFCRLQCAIIELCWSELYYLGGYCVTNKLRRIIYWENVEVTFMKLRLALSFCECLNRVSAKMIVTIFVFHKITNW